MNAIDLRKILIAPTTYAILMLYCAFRAIALRSTWRYECFEAFDWPIRK